MKRGIESTLAQLLSGYWDTATIYVSFDGAIVHTAIHLDEWGWAGNLTRVQWHRLMQRAINELGRLPNVLDTNGRSLARLS